MSNVDNIMKKIAERIKELRGDMTQKEFAALFDVSPQAVSEWEKANKMPRMWVIEKIALKYGVSKSYILGEDNGNVSGGILFQNGKIIEVGGLPEEAQKEIESYINYIRQKYADETVKPDTNNI